MSDLDQDLAVDWRRIADAMRHRMRVLQLSQRALGDLADVSPQTVRNLLYVRNDQYRTATLTGLSEALGWGDDGLIRIGRGEDPDAIEAEVARYGDDDVMRTLGDIQSKLDEITLRLTRVEGRDADAG